MGQGIINTRLIYEDGYLWRRSDGKEIITLDRGENYCEVTAGTENNGIYTYYTEDAKQFSGNIILKFNGSAVHYNKGKVTVKTYYISGHDNVTAQPIYELERTERYNVDDVVPITELFTPHTEGYNASFYNGDIKKNPDIRYSQFAYVRNENNDETFKQLWYANDLPILYNVETGEFSEDAMGRTISITYEEYMK